MTRRITITLAAAVLSGCGLFGLTGCGDPDPAWTGTVEQDIDNLTGEPTGYYSTWGPSVSVSVHGRPTTVSVGYFCYHGDARIALDGLAVQLAMPLDSTRLRTQFAAAAPNIRLAVDRVPIAWDFGLFATDTTVAFHARPVFPQPPNPPPSSTAIRTLGRTAYLDWEPYRDQVLELVATADSVGFDLGDIGSTVVRFPVGDITAAVDAVRFWCPMLESLDSLNATRNETLARADSRRADQQARDSVAHARRFAERAEADRRAAERHATAQRREAERQAAAERAEAERQANRERTQADTRRSRQARAAAETAMASPLPDLLAESMELTVVQQRTFLAVAAWLDVAVSSADDIARVCREDIDAVMQRFRVPGIPRETRQAVLDGCALVLRERVTQEVLS